MLKKSIISMLMLSTILFSTVAFADTAPTNGWWFNEGQQTLMYYKDGVDYANGWFEIDGKKYYFDESGFAKRGHVHMFDKEYTFDRDTGEFIGEGFIELPPLSQSKYK